ncbi:hypothetical protein BDF21DRAFT_427530, partial [Thamnidium elegans]
MENPPVQKELKKIDCKAKFQISFDPADPSDVNIKNSCQHNHRDVRVSLQKHFSQSATSTHPDHFVHADEIYNIYRKIQQQRYKLRDNL